jgi:hypothetical protein
MTVARSAEGGHRRDPIQVPTTCLEYDYSVVVDGQICISPDSAAPDSAPKSERVRNARLFAAAPKTYLAAKLSTLMWEYVTATLSGSGEGSKAHVAESLERVQAAAEALGWQQDEPLLPWIYSYSRVAVLLAEEGSPA